MTTFGLFMWMLALIIYMHGTGPHSESLAGLLVGLGAGSIALMPIVTTSQRLIVSFIRYLNGALVRLGDVTAYGARGSAHAQISAVPAPTNLYTSQSTRTPSQDVATTNQSTSLLPTTSMLGEHGPVEGANWPQLRRTGDALGNRYLVLELLARTGYRIYRALDVWTGQLVAIKQCAPQSPEIDIPLEVLERCLANEAAIMSVLPQGTAPSLVEVLQEGIALTLVMTWLPGQRLRDVLDADALSLEQALSLALRICDAVAAIHSLVPPLLHKDLKPENLIVLPSGDVIPIDFGIAAWLVPEHTNPEAMGTLPYTAPEQRRGEQVDRRADVYALGMILREVLEYYAHIPIICCALDHATAEVQHQRTSTVMALQADLIAASLKLTQ